MALVEAGHCGCRRASEPVEQGSDFPILEHTPLVGLSVAGKNVKRTCVTCGYQLQHPHFRRAKPGRAPGKLFKQLQHAWTELRKQAQISLKQIEPGLRRRRTIGL